MAASRKPKSVLVFAAALLLASGGVRIGVGLGPAIAFAEEQLETGDAEQLEESPQPPEIEPVLAALQVRESRVSEREVALENRMFALSVAEEEIAKRLAELEAAEQSLSEAITVSETANDGDITRLTAVYENMKPADAANLFEEMAPDFASGFLVRMRPEAAAAILAGLEPQTAYSISVIIAGRNADAPTE
jgi:flagellar motility protein MotE (MotC chaperone)